MSGRSGARLARLAGLSTLADAFELWNVLDRFPGAEARGDAFPLAEAREAIRASESALRGRRVVLLGGSVAAAVRWRGAPLEWGVIEKTAWTPERGLELVARYDVALLPHPSGLNHWWNDPENEAAASRFLKEEVRRWQRQSKVTSSAQIRSSTRETAS